MATTTPSGGSSGNGGAPLGEGCPKRPWHSKKWTYAMWVTTLLCVLFVYYIERVEDVKDVVLYTLLALIGALAVLTIGGVYALDRYRMGLVQVVEAVRGKDVDETANALSPTAGTTRSPLDDEISELPSSAVVTIEDPEDTEDPETFSK